MDIKGIKHPVRMAWAVICAPQNIHRKSRNFGGRVACHYHGNHYGSSYRANCRRRVAGTGLSRSLDSNGRCMVHKSCAANFYGGYLNIVKNYLIKC